MPSSKIYHLYCPLLAPDAVKVTLDPSQPVAPVAPGGFGVVETVRTTLLLIILPHVLLIRQLYVPASVKAVIRKTIEAEVCPGISTPSFRH